MLFDDSDWFNQAFILAKKQPIYIMIIDELAWFENSALLFSFKSGSGRTELPAPVTFPVFSTALGFFKHLEYLTVEDRVNACCGVLYSN